MISFEYALSIALTKAKLLKTEKTELSQATGRILAKNVFADVDIPPFNKSTMDGYACRNEDLESALTIVEIIPAGCHPTKRIGPKECSKIMTGARVPEGADTVFMVEYAKENGAGKVRFTGENTNSNICLKGEDLKKEDLVISEGTLLKPQHIAMLATVGCVSPLVYQNPQIGIISTGSELVDPDRIPTSSQIRNSNGPQLYAQATQYGFPAKSYGIVPDDKKLIEQFIEKSIQENDVTLISGGVSVGDFDFVPQIIQDLGFEIHFSKINIKPGQHTTFASNKNKYIIGLPGNPVSSFIQFKIFALPFLRKLMNYSQPEVQFPMPMGHDFRRKNSGLQECLPVQITSENEIRMIDYHGSAHIHAYHQALGFIILPEGKTEIKKGELVHVRLL